MTNFKGCICSGFVIAVELMDANSRIQTALFMSLETCWAISAAQAGRWALKQLESEFTIFCWHACSIH
jgi:hypothetical protein